MQGTLTTSFHKLFTHQKGKETEIYACNARITAQLVVYTLFHSVTLGEIPLDNEIKITQAKLNHLI